MAEDAEALVKEAEDFLKEAHERLEWLREEYGEDDIDYQTFSPLVELIEVRLAELKSQV